MSDRRHFIPRCQQQIDKDSRNESPRPGATHCLLCRERQEVHPIRDGIINQDSRLRQAEETECDTNTRFLHHRRRLRIGNGNDAISTRAQRHRNDGKDACALAAMTPSQRGQLKDSIFFFFI